MTMPLRVTCPTAGDIPPVHQLRVWVTIDRHVVLRFPHGTLAGPAQTKEAVVARLAAALTGFEVRDGGLDRGSDCVTVRRVCHQGDRPPDPSSPCQAPPGWWGEE